MSKVGTKTVKNTFGSTTLIIPGRKIRILPVPDPTRLYKGTELPEVLCAGTGFCSSEAALKSFTESLASWTVRKFSIYFKTGRERMKI